MERLQIKGQLEKRKQRHKLLDKYNAKFYNVVQYILVMHPNYPNLMLSIPTILL